MERLKALFINKGIWVSVILTCNGLATVMAQGNCFQYPENSGERKACELAYSSDDYKQGSRASQQLLDSIISIGPKFAWAYYQKSVPFFKRGYLSKGIEILNKAIAIEPQAYLCYRAYWYHQHKSYRSVIKDLELYYRTYGGYIEFTPGGEHEMRMLLGMSYAGLGELDSAIRVISDYLNNPKNEIHLRGEDYYVLGVLQYRNGQYAEAAEALVHQIEINPKFADAYHYLGLVLKAQGDAAGADRFFKMAVERFDGVDGGYTKRVLGIPSSVGLG